MKGIDISNNDGNVDFNQVKNAGYEIVYLKATEGLTYDDPMMKEFYDEAKAANLKIGFYHFLRKNDPGQEAQHFLNIINGLSYDCIAMVDVEHDSLKDGSASWRTQQFSDYCKAKGIQVGIYTYSSFLKESMNNNTLGLPLWVAEYSVSNPNVNVPYIGFQYSETGRVPGVSTNCDLDEFSESILNGGKQKVEYVVVYNNLCDQRSAEMLADYLECPTVWGVRKFDFSCVKTVIGVGSVASQYTNYLTKLLSGASRYDTNQAVLDFIKNNGK